jgi:hypothetical protein
MAAAKKTVIRNLMWIPQNLRFGETKKDAVELARRGQRGDVAAISVDQKDSTAFKMGLGRFFEEITQAEADKIVYQDGQYTGPAMVDANGNPVVVGGVYTQDDVTVGAQNIYTDPRTGKIYHRVGPVGPRVANLPGTDPAMAAAAQAQIPGVNSVEMPLPTQGRTDTPIDKGQA